MSKLIIEILQDGTIKTNAREVIGTEDEILAELNALASEVGGELEVEKHVEGAHNHHHGGNSHHHLLRGGHRH